MFPATVGTQGHNNAKQHLDEEHTPVPFACRQLTRWHCRKQFPWKKRLLSVNNVKLAMRHSENREAGKLSGTPCSSDTGRQTPHLHCTFCTSVSELILLTSHGRSLFLSYIDNKPVTQNGSATCIFWIWPQKPLS